jgi:hypothetical protein
VAVGTAIVVVAILYFLVTSAGFRKVIQVAAALCAVGILWLANYGADKPQTLFYDSEAHPAFLMKAGDVCPQDRHVWRDWCVK